MNFNINNKISDMLIESNEIDKFNKIKFILEKEKNKFKNLEFNKLYFKDLLKKLYNEDYDFINKISKFISDENMLINFYKNDSEVLYLDKIFKNALDILKKKKFLFNRLFENDNINKYNIYGIWLFNGTFWEINILDDSFLLKNSYDSINFKINKFFYIILLEKAFLQCFGYKLKDFSVLDYIKALTGVNHICIFLNKFENLDILNKILKDNNNKLLAFKNKSSKLLYPLNNIDIDFNLLEIYNFNNLNNNCIIDFNQLKNEFEEVNILDCNNYFFNTIDIENKINYLKLFVYNNSNLNLIINDNNLCKYIIAKIENEESITLKHYCKNNNSLFNLEKGDYLLILINYKNILFNRELYYYCNNPIDIEYINIEDKYFIDILLYLFKNYIINNNLEFELKYTHNVFNLVVKETFIKDFEIYIFKIESNFINTDYDNTDIIFKFKTSNKKNFHFYPKALKNKKEILKVFYKCSNNINFFIGEKNYLDKEFEIIFNLEGWELFTKSENYKNENKIEAILKNIFFLKKIKLQNHYSLKYRIKNEDESCCNIY